MDDLERISTDKKAFSKLGFAFTLYYLGFNGLFILAKQIPGVTEGYGYLLASLLSFVFLLVWKKPAYFHQCCISSRRMGGRRLIMLLIAVTGCQALFQVLRFLMDLFITVTGLDGSRIVPSAATVSADVGMLLYAFALAPIMEEFVFRGIFLRSFLRFGKIFAIVMSSLFFGLLHTNPIQSPFAFTAGLIFGYVAVEYSIFWSLGLHIFNNLVLGGILPNILARLPVGVGDVVTFMLYWSCASITAVYIISNSKSAMCYIQRNKPNKGVLNTFFTAPGVLISVILLAGFTFAVLFI